MKTEIGAKLKAQRTDSLANLPTAADSSFAQRESVNNEGPAQSISVNSRKYDCHRTACLVHALGWCAEARRPGVDTKRNEPSQQIQTISARRMVFHPNEWLEYVPIICDGWATYSIVGADGRRQILSFRLPGDIISTAWLWEKISGRSVEAITQVTYRKFERNNFITALLNISSLREKLLKALSNELAHIERLMYGVGRRRADERIARLIVRLSERLAERNMMQGQTMEFPLRQRDIADITGLTHEHVSKVLGSFQRTNLIKISDRALTIINQAELRSRAWHPFL